MSNNCLVTKLKDTVENSNLPVLNTLIIDVKSNAGYSSNMSSIMFKASEALVIKTTGSGYFATTFAGLDDPSERLTELTVNANTNQRLYFYNGNYQIYVNNKYTLTELTFYNSAGHASQVFSFDLEDIEYSRGITSIRTYGTAKGDISKLSKMTDLVILNLTLATLTSGNVNSLEALSKLETIQFYGCQNISGSIEYLAKKNLSVLGIDGTHITSTVENLVSLLVTAQHAAATESSPVDMSSSIINLTFNGTPLTDIATHAYLTWESTSKIAVLLGNPVGAVNATVVYCMGYTQSEAETNWPGKAIVRVDA